jgi:hypothetical protein
MTRIERREEARREEKRREEKGREEKKRRDECSLAMLVLSSGMGNTCFRN